MYEVEEREFTSSEIINGVYPIVVATKTVNAGKTVEKNAPVKLVSGKLEPVTNESNVTETVKDLYGIAAEKAVAGTEVAVYLTGEFKAEGLHLETSVTATDLEIAFRQLGIFLA